MECRLAAVSGVATNPIPSQVEVAYAYDANGNRTLVSTPTGSTSYSYNNRNRLETTNDGLSTTSFTYYPDGKKNTVVYPNGTDVKYTYHPTNRVKTVGNKVTTSGSVISSYAYEYDKNGNRTLQTEVQDGTTETTAYTYDVIDRLKTFTVIGSGNTTLTEYTFEGYNRKTEKITQNSAVTASKTYSYDETEWLTKVEDSVNLRTINYAYDRNGNTMAKTDSLSPAQNKNFVYDSLNRLVQAKGASNNVLGLYDYNSAGLRIRHRNSDRGDIDYFYDGRSVIDEYDASNNSFLAHYRYADRLLNLTTLTGIQYYHHDGLGSTVNLTDTSATTQVSYRLDPWGHIRSQSGYSLNRNIFTGKEHDVNTGYIYFGARYYDPDTARFTTQDTYLGEPGTPPSLHRYLYAYSNPTVYVDLFGYESEKMWFETYWKDPLNIASDYWKDKLHSGTYDTLGTQLVGAGAETTIDVVHGLLSSPVTVGEEIGLFAYEPKLENVPILGSVGKNLGTSTARMYEDPSFENAVQMGGAVGSAFLTVAPFLPKGSALTVPRTVEAPALISETTEAAVAAEKGIAAKMRTEPKINGEVSQSVRTGGREMLEKIKQAYEESPLGNERGGVRVGKGEQSTGNVYWDSKVSRWRDSSTGRFVKTEKSGPVIIGETMLRVEAVAAKIPGAKILNDMPDFKAMGIPDHQVTSLMMQYNRKWILEQMRSGRQIIDIGADPNRAMPSIFYQMEQNMLKNYKELHPEFTGGVSP